VIKRDNVERSVLIVKLVRLN